VAQALQQAAARGLERIDAQLTAAAALGVTRGWLLAHDRDPLPAERGQRLHDWLNRRVAGEPLAYLLGEKEFFGLRLRVTPDTLVPRPDTETLVHWALGLLPAPPHCTADTVTPMAQVADLGTGSGAIGLAIAAHHPGAHITLVDLSPAALAVALDNAHSLGLSGRVQGVQGSWLAPLEQRRFDLIVSNPPYIAEHDAHLRALRHEPLSALASGPDGLDDLRHIVAQAPAQLQPGAWLLLEHGFDQADRVQALLRGRGFEAVNTRLDLAGQPRCTGGRWPGD
jgi:release factor glutamine methyltransferase